MLQIRIGPVIDMLQKLVDEKHTPFDIIFIDVDKINNCAYFEYSLKLS